MLLGQTIRAPLGASATYYGPWFPRQGTKAVFARNVIATGNVDDTAQFQIAVQTRRIEDNNRDSLVFQVGAVEQWAPADDTVRRFVRGIALDDEDAQGFFELVRFKYALTSESALRAFLHFRILQPTWETD